MANRQQEYRGPQNWTRRSSNERYWENGDDERQWGRERERERERYGQNSESEEYDEGRVQFGRPRDTDEESGSTGRTAGHAGYGDFAQDDYDRPGRRPNTGQGRYGQTGYGQDRYDAGYGAGSRGNYGYGRSGRYEGGRGESRGAGRYGYGGSGLRGSGAGYGSGQWYEPYGEGQQYGSRYGLGEGPHRGKGPKGYQRSDERIKEMICERLREDPDIDASDVTVTVQVGKVTLEGTVDHRHTKNAIEDVAEQLGVGDVQNNLRVQRAGQQGAEQAGRSSMGNLQRTTLGADEGETTKQKRN